MCDIACADDARTAYAGSYSAWLTKVKADDAKAKWFSNHTRRLFTIDFEAQLFYYSNGAVSRHLRFRELVSAELLARSSKISGKGKDVFGFVLQTDNRAFYLFASSHREASRWVQGINAAAFAAAAKLRAREEGRRVPTFAAEGEGRRAPSFSSASTKDDAGSSGRSSPAPDSHGTPPRHAGDPSPVRGGGAGGAVAEAPRGPSGGYPSLPPVWHTGQAASPAGRGARSVDGLPLPQCEGQPEPFRDAARNKQRRSGGAPLLGGETDNASAAVDTFEEESADPPQDGQAPAPPAGPNALAEEFASYTHKQRDAFAALDALEEEFAGPPQEDGQAPAAPAAPGARELQKARLFVTAGVRPEQAEAALAAQEAVASAAAAAETAAAQKKRHSDLGFEEEDVEKVLHCLYGSAAASAAVERTKGLRGNCQAAAVLPERASIAIHNPDAVCWDSDDDDNDEADLILGTPSAAQATETTAFLTRHNPHAASWDSDDDDDGGIAAEGTAAPDVEKKETRKPKKKKEKAAGAEKTSRKSKSKAAHDDGAQKPEAAEEQSLAAAN